MYVKGNDTLALDTGILRSDFIRNTLVSFSFIYYAETGEESTSLQKSLLPERGILKYI